LGTSKNRRPSIFPLAPGLLQALQAFLHGDEALVSVTGAMGKQMEKSPRRWKSHRKTWWKTPKKQKKHLENMVENGKHGGKHQKEK